MSATDRCAKCGHDLSAHVARELGGPRCFHCASDRPCKVDFAALDAAVIEAVDAWESARYSDSDFPKKVMALRATVRARRDARAKEEKRG